MTGSVLDELENEYLWESGEYSVDQRLRYTDLGLVIPYLQIVEVVLCELLERLDLVLG